MKIIKEYCQAGKRCIIRTDTYVSTLQHFLDLLEEARQDFPDLKPEDVEIKHYGGIRYAGTYGIEFKVTHADVPKCYSPVKMVEATK